MSGALPAGVVSDDFVAGHLGRPAWKISAADAAEPSTVVAAAVGAGVGLASTRLAEDDTDGRRLLEESGFRAIGTLITYRLDLCDGFSNEGVRVAGPIDVAPCARIAEVAHRTDRFHADPLIPGEIADAIKVAWVQNAFAGRADQVLVCDEGGGVAGFNVCIWRPPIGVIDLVAVAARARGKGVARRLIAAMAKDASGMGLEAIEAGTQENNSAARALYQRLGFLPARRQIDFHWTP